MYNLTIFSMSKKRFFKSYWLLAAGFGLMAVGCADDGFDDESFQSGNGVTNTQLVSPSADDITITASPDGSKQTIAWPVVYGAGGYQAILKNLTEDEIVVDTIIDGLSFATSRLEDTNYEVTVQVLGNEKLGNKAGEVTSKLFTTFADSYATIPTGTDLYQYFQDNPVPAPAEDAESDEIIYDLEAGGEYTVSQPLDMGLHKVLLRTNDKLKHAIITLAEGAYFVCTDALSFNYLSFDCSATAKPFILLNENPDESLLPEPVDGKQSEYFRIKHIKIQNSEIMGVNASLIYDNNKKYCVATLLIKNTIIQMQSVADNIKNESWISFQGGGAKDFSVINSTIYQTGTDRPKYFIRYNNSVRIDRIGWPTTDHTTMTYLNSTFYNVNAGNWANYAGISNYSQYDLQNNIWVDCGDGAIARRVMGNSRLGTNSSINYFRNTYWKDGEATDQSTYDTTETALTTDPAFVDAANGNFTPTGAEQVEYQTGDPRWLESK